MSILNETQLDRDIELTKILGISLKEVQSLPIATPESIRIFNGDKEPKKKIELYSNYEYLNWYAYLRTLMKTSATRRHPELFQLLRNTKNKECLDFGSGVGTHAIALLENNNEITIVDVPGKLLEFARQRILERGFAFWSFDNDEELKNCHYDLAICTDVLEHVDNPINELDRIHKALKVGGILHLQVSTMVKPSSGHFASTINIWKKYGQQCLDKYFIKEAKTIYKKI